MKFSSKYSDFVKHLQKGEICIFETDTVVGIACTIYKDFISSKSKSLNSNIERIFQLKKRSYEKKLPLLVSDIEMLNKLTKNISLHTQHLINKEWPGSTTLVLEAADYLPPELIKINKSKKTIAIRIPNNQILIDAIKTTGCPLACTSANLSGESPVNSLNKVNKSLLERVDFVFTQHFYNSSNKPSKIIDCINDEFKTIRFN